MLILVQINNDIYFESFQIHLQVIMYHLKHTNHDNNQDFLF